MSPVIHRVVGENVLKERTPLRSVWLAVADSESVVLSGVIRAG